jgi:hypothetical protein
VTPKITQKQWEDYVVTTALLLGWEESRWDKRGAGARWRRAMQWLEDKKHMHVCINGMIVNFIPPTNPQE